MALVCKGIFVVGAKRTPFCSHGGLLKELQASHAFAAAAKAALASSNVDPVHVDNTIVGNVNFLSQCDGGKTPRYCGIYSGVPISKPALGVNKACGSGLQAVISGAVDILTGLAKISLTGGTELMSALPFLVRNVRFGTTLGATYHLEDHIKKQLVDSYCGLSLHQIAESLAKKYKINRLDVDEFALLSHQKWKTAQVADVFQDELAPVTVTIKKKTIVVDRDELPRSDIQAEDLETLEPLLDGGSVVTAGNCSIPADGAASLLLANEEAVKAYGLRPLARVTGWACLGVEPVDTGLGATLAIRRLLETVQMKVEDVDLFEIDETFASQTLVTAKVLNIESAKINVCGGALALGHPVAATGARMAVHLSHQLSRCKAKRAIAASSCGGGQGIAIMLETP